MSKISILTPSVRPEGLPIVNTALRRQTFRDFEWIIGSPFDPELGDKWSEDNHRDGVWSLNRIYNSMIKQAKGDLIVSLQDFTFVDPDALERLWRHYLADSSTLVSGVGNKYDKVYPELGEILWEDPRKTSGLTTFNNIEFNFCSIPKKALYDIGGFDEEMDFKFFGMDGYNVGERLTDLNYKFFLDTSLKSYSLGHGRVDNWEELNGIHGPYQQHVSLRKASKQWPKLTYLT